MSVLVGIGTEGPKGPEDRKEAHLLLDELWDLREGLAKSRDEYITTQIAFEYSLIDQTNQTTVGVYTASLGWIIHNASPEEFYYERLLLLKKLGRRELLFKKF